MRCSVASTTASHVGRPSCFQMFDLHNQDHRVADQNADQSQDPEDRDESQRRATRQQRYDDADQGERRDREHQEQALEALQLDHQDRGHDEKHQRNDRRNRRLALGALLDRAADRPPNSRLAEPLRTPPPAARVGRPRSSAAPCRRMLAFSVIVGMPRPPPYCRLLDFVVQGGDGAKRHGLSA